jgi:hypothetical protein
MSSLSRVISGALLLVVGLAGCGASTAPTVFSAQTQCERNGGTWRSASGTCQFESGGGGGY